MADIKKFYWIKLKDKFMTSDAVDFLMSQENGANYVVLYQMLCLKTINTNGRLERQIGEIIVPYDAQKIQRDCKYFSIDTVVIALGLYKKLGLIYQEKDNAFQISDFENLIGGETSKAEIMRRKRAQKSALKGGNNVTKALPKSYPKVTEEIEIRDRVNILPTEVANIQNSGGCKYGIHSNVFLEDYAYAQLRDQLGETVLNDYINRLSGWIKSGKPIPYKDPATAISKWWNEDAVKRNAVEEKSVSKAQTTQEKEKQNFVSRSLSAEELNATFGKLSDDEL